MIALKDLSYNRPGYGWARLNRINSAVAGAVPKVRSLLFVTDSIDAAYGPVDHELQSPGRDPWLRDAP